MINLGCQLKQLKSISIFHLMIFSSTLSLLLLNSIIRFREIGISLTDGGRDELRVENSFNFGYCKVNMPEKSKCV